MTLQKVLEIVNSKRKKVYCTKIYDTLLYWMHVIGDSNLKFKVQLFDMVKVYFLDRLTRSKLDEIELSFMKSLIISIVRKFTNQMKRVK